MRGIHLAVQTAIVLATVSLVSWPEFRPSAHVQRMWSYSPSLAYASGAENGAMYDEGGMIRPASLLIGSRDLTQSSRTSTDSAGRARASATDAAFIPQAVAVRGGRVNALVGMARTSVNVPIPHAKLLLRNIRTGQVQARTAADEQGQFTFLDLDGNTYIVELLGADGAVMAASEVVALTRGEVRLTQVRAAASASTVAASFGSALAATMPQATEVALASGVTRTTTSLVAQESTR
jgi:hypothetical protein